MSKIGKIEVPAYVPYNQRCGLAKSLADRWFDKYLESGQTITPELEQERKAIVDLFVFPPDKQR